VLLFRVHRLATEVWGDSISDPSLRVMMSMKNVKCVPRRKPEISLSYNVFKNGKRIVTCMEK